MNGPASHRWQFPALGLSAALLASACGGGDDSPPPLGYRDAGTEEEAPPRDAGTRDAEPADPCRSPNLGCACEPPGETVECGRIERISGDYVSCSIGIRTCGEDGTWGDCIGDRIVEVPVGESLPLSLGTSTHCVDNPCDPHCEWFIDNPIGVPLGDGGLGLTDGGIHLIKGPPKASNGVACTGIAVSPPSQTLTVTAINAAKKLKGEYFNQRNSTGIPTTWTPNAIRRDGNINFDFGSSAPAGIAGLLADDFSIRWTGFVVPPTTGTYRFYTNSDDGARLWIDDTLVVDKWVDQGVTEHASGNISLTRNVPVSIKLEYYERGGGAAVQLLWSGPGIAKQVVPEAYLSGSDSTQPFTVSPANVDFNVTTLPNNCYTGHINAAWSIDRLDLATIDSDGVFSLFTPVSTTVNVKAYAGQFNAAGTVNVVVNARDTSDAPGTTGTVFTGNGSGTDPMQVLYPYADTVFPLGMRAPVIQWSTGNSAATAVKIGLRFPATGAAKFLWEAIIAETNPPRAVIPTEVWDYFEQAAKGQEAAYTVQRYIGTALRPTVTRNIRFANAPLRGKIYYTEYGRSDNHAYIMGADPGSEDQAASVFSTASETSGNKCPVCHSMSANGQMFVTANRSWSSNGGVSRVTNGVFQKLSDFPSSSGYNTNADDWRGFAWAPLTPNGTYALAANNIWGNTDQDNVAGINTSNRTVNAPSTFLSGGRGTGLTAKYYNSATLGGTPYQRTDQRVAFSWAAAAPVTYVGTNNFSVRWTGFVEPLTTETYTFEVIADDGVRLLVNDVSLFDAWSNASGSTTSTRSGTIALEAGQRYPIRLDYVDKTNNASVTLRWSSPKVAAQIIPQAQLYPESPGSGVAATYYDNGDFTGTSVSTVEPDVYFDWAADAPWPGFGVNTWSAIYTGRIKIPVASTSWQLCLNSGSESGDSMKLFLNNSSTAVINQTNGASSCTANQNFTAGQIVPFRIEYDDNNNNAQLLMEWVGPSITRQRIPTDAFLLPTGYTEPANGLTATYYDTDDFGASSTSTTTVPAFSRIETTVNMNWGSARPNYSALTSSDTWSVRYTGLVRPSCTGMHELQVESDDGASLWVDGIRVATRSSAGTAAGALHLTSGQFYELKLDVVEASNNAAAILRWKPCGAGSFAVVPQANLYPSGDVGWSGFTRGGGDNGSDFTYKVWQLPQASNQNPTDVTGQSAHNWGLSNSVMMVPSFAPNNQKLVFVDGDQAGGAGWRKGLSTFDFDQANKQFKGRRLIVNNWPLGDVIKWPTFESDSRSVLFQTSTPVEFCCRNNWTRYGHMAPTNYYEEPGRLWSIDANADAPVPVELTRLNQGERDVDRNKAYQATMLPTAAAGYRWAVFTSTRPYGNTINTTGQQSYANPSSFTAMLNYTAIQSQLWVAAIDDTTSGSTDRSYPAFWLPNQNYTESASSSSGFINERAFWVLDACKSVGTSSASLCEVDEDCCGGDASPKTAVCRLDTPVTNPPTRHCATVTTSTTCHLPGDICSADAECCEGGYCINGMCAEPPSLGAFYPANFERVYTSQCPSGTQATWRFFDLKAETPPVGSKIEVYAQSADSTTGFHTLDIAPNPIALADVVYLGAITGATFPGWQGFDVGGALRNANSFSWKNLKITLRFVPNNDLTASPVVYEWRQSYSCPPNE